jgi:hypothetical protein
LQLFADILCVGPIALIDSVRRSERHLDFCELMVKLSTATVYNQESDHAQVTDDG